jgi:hypothetical protein
MLPLFELSECQTCGHEHQGTRAKAGNSVACAGCGTMRRVPTDRPTAGPDDPRATRPVRGRPLKAGNPWRYQAEDEPSRPTKATSANSPARASNSHRIALDSFREVMSRFTKNPHDMVEMTTDTGDGTDCMDVVRLAASFDQKNPRFGLCWEASKGWKKVQFWIEHETTDAVPSPSRTALNQSQRTASLSTQPVVRERRGYVNPLTCSHPELSFDAWNNCYQCVDCSHVVPAQNMHVVQE